MGIKPILERQPTFPKEYIGYSQSAFFGGRASAHIRNVPLPVVYTDFLSMYPTVNSLMGLWGFVVAEKIDIIEHCGTEIEEFLRRVTPDDLFKPDTWKQLTGFVRIIPAGDMLPSRGQYNFETNDWQVAVNHIYAKNPDPEDALWFSLPAVVASVIDTGRVPKIVDAFRIENSGSLSGLNVTKLRGIVEVEPATEDLFKVAIEERKRLSRNTTLSKIEKDRLDKALKVLANATSYGIYGEMNLGKAHAVSPELRRGEGRLGFDDDAGGPTDEPWNGVGDGSIHVARTGARRRVGCPHRHIFIRSRALRNGHGAPALHRPYSRVNVRRHPAQ